MSTEEQIQAYISSQMDAKHNDMLELHRVITELKPDAKLWFLDGKNEDGKMVTNPNVGYGTYTLNYADGGNREFYQVGFTGNTGGISVYIMGIADKKHLVNAYGGRIGKATVTGYCIKFKKLQDIDLDVLKEAMKFGFEAN